MENHTILLWCQLPRRSYYENRPPGFGCRKRSKNASPYSCSYFTSFDLCLISFPMFISLFSWHVRKWSLFFLFSSFMQIGQSINPSVFFSCLVSFVKSRKLARSMPFCHVSMCFFEKLHEPNPKMLKILVKGGTTNLANQHISTH